jgi:hypothetical protein
MEGVFLAEMSCRCYDKKECKEQKEHHSYKIETWNVSTLNQGGKVTRRRGRRSKKLLDDLGDRRGDSHLTEKALDRTKWRNRFGRGFGPVDDDADW